MKILILGYGNTLRKDDGLGVYAAQTLSPLVESSNVEVYTCQQLSPELSPMLARADHAIFIDAAAASNGEEPGTINTRSLQPRTTRPSGITHHFDPETLLAMAETLYGHVPQAVLFSVTSASFELDEGLSPEIAATLPVLVDRIQEYISAWTGE